MTPLNNNKFSLWEEVIWLNKGPRHAKVLHFEYLPKTGVWIYHIGFGENRDRVTCCTEDEIQHNFHNLVFKEPITEITLAPPPSFDPGQRRRKRKSRRRKSLKTRKRKSRREGRN